jgi:hypothetical protein
MMINNKKSSAKALRKNMICNSEVTESTSSKLLGVIIDNDIKWKGHIYGKSGVLSSLNQRLFTIRRLSHHIHQSKLKEIADRIWVSKLRYGLQLFSEVRTINEQPTSQIMKELLGFIYQSLECSIRGNEKSAKFHVSKENHLGIL